MSLSYSFLTENRGVCPTPATFEKLLFWTLGYGGWLGVCVLPIVWSLPVSKTIRTILSTLALPTCALVLTAVFSALYVVSLFTYHVSVVMISPQFLHSCIGTVCLSVGSLAVFMAGQGVHVQVVKDSDETEEGSEGEGSESVEEGSEASEGESEGSEGSDDSEDESEGSESNEGSDREIDNTWREKANFEGLRTAAPLPE